MTDGDRLRASEAREAIFARDGWLCRWCGRPIREGVPQLAHRIPQRKHFIARYGLAVIHHPDNLASACSLLCNGRLDIGGQPQEIARLAEKIKKALDTDKKVR